ncbi:MAG: type II secretion system protein [Candidatus Paceibacterota bacterium]
MKAFTLIELIIVISITVILFAMGFLRLFDFRQHQALNLAKQGIVAILRDAQNRSISQESGTRWGVHFENPSGAANDFYELFSGTVYSSSSVVSKNNLDPEIQFSNPVAGSSKDVIFLPITGQLTAVASTTISLVSDSSVFNTITIDANGRIQY